MARRVRVNGPYRHRARWRVFVVRPDGSRDARSFATEEEALSLVASLQKQLAGDIVLKEAIALYLTYLKAIPVEAVTLENSERFLFGFFDHKVGFPLRKLTPSKCQSLYDALLTRKHYRGAGYSAATRKAWLVEAKRFGGFVVKKKLMKASPFDSVDHVGRPKRGKKKLRPDEARTYMDYCLSAYANGDQKALIPLLCLGLNLRAGEVTKLQSRDVSDKGLTLTIEDAKTEAGNRTQEVHPMLATYIYAQAKDRVGQLIPGCTEAVVYHQVKRFCRLAGVTSVCPHGLRGTHADLAASRGATSAMLMEALGHTSINITKRHYLEAGTMERVASDKVWGRLAGNVLEEVRSPTPIDVIGGKETLKKSDT